MLKTMLRLYSLHPEGRSDLGIIEFINLLRSNYNLMLRNNLTNCIPTSPYGLLCMTMFFCILLFSCTIFAEEKSLPRFATIKSNHVNARTGPGITYPIEWVFISRGEPVKVTAEFEQWRKVEDINGTVGWIHSSILSTKRSVVITSKNQHILLKSPKKDSRIVAKLENGLRCNLDKIENGWCKLKCKSYKGWVEANYVWGVTKSEAGNE